MDAKIRNFSGVALMTFFLIANSILDLYVHKSFRDKIFYS